MSVSQPARCLLSTPAVPSLRSRTYPRAFHTSLKLSQRKRSRFRSIKAVEMGLISNQMPAREIYKPYDKQEKQLLKRRYDSSQIAAIEAGEQSIDPEDLKTQGVFRTDIGSLKYLEDLSINAAHIDSKLEKLGARESDERMMTPDEWGTHLADHLTKTGSHVKVVRKRNRAFEDHWIKDKIPCFQCGETGHNEMDCTNAPLPLAERKTLKTDWETIGRKEALANVNEEDPKFKKMAARLDEMNNADAMRAFQSFTGWIGSKGPIIDDPSTNVGAADATAPILPRKIDPLGVAEEEAPRDDRDPHGSWDKLRLQTGYSLDQILQIDTPILFTNYVTNQTRLGKIQSLYCLAIAGDRKGRLGIGEAKGIEDADTRHSAVVSAIRNMKPIPRYEERTIHGEVKGKVAATEVHLMSRPPGFGLRTQRLIFEMCRAAGIHDLSARVPRSRNKMNTVKATYKALMSQKMPDEIARGRGIKLVDVRKVYYGGRV